MEGDDQFTRVVNDIRSLIKSAAVSTKIVVSSVKSDVFVHTDGADKGEIIANLMLTYRHLEDASMRLGKAIQAHDGGVSVYDKATTVGA